jgi:hypothetical protein
MQNSQGLSDNPYPVPNQPNSLYDTYFLKIHSHIVLRLGLPRGILSVGLPVKILKALLSSFILAT